MNSTHILHKQLSSPKKRLGFTLADRAGFGRVSLGIQPMESHGTGGMGLEIKDKNGCEILLSVDGGRPSQLLADGEVKDSAARTSTDDEFIVFVNSSGVVVYRVDEKSVTPILRYDIGLVAPLRYQLVADEAVGTFSNVLLKENSAHVAE